MHYRIEKFKMEHLDTYVPREVQKRDLEHLKLYSQHQHLWCHSLPIFTLFADETPVMIYGMANNGFGTYNVMVFAAEGVDKCTHAMVRCLYKYVDEFVGDDVKRFEAHVSMADKEANRLARFFGFELIGIRRDAAPNGEDQGIYERLWRK